MAPSRAGSRSSTLGACSGIVTGSGSGSGSGSGAGTSPSSCALQVMWVAPQTPRDAVSWPSALPSERTVPLKMKSVEALLQWISNG